MATVVHIGEIQDAVHGLGDGGTDQVFTKLFVKAHAQDHDVVSGLAQFAVHDGKHITEVQVVYVVDDYRDITASPGTEGGCKGIADISHPDSGLTDLRTSGFREPRIPAERPGNRVDGIAARACDILEGNAVDSHTGPSMNQINVITNIIA